LSRSPGPPGPPGPPEPPETTAVSLLDADQSLLELVDHLLHQGVVLTGDVVIGLAGVDLIYLKLSALLCPADRLLPLRPREERKE
jgi:hypothetical protein